MLCLCSSLFGTGRIVHADSAFSSVKTLIALEEKGLYFQGMVKTAHKEYPMGFMKDWENGLEEGGVPSRGEWCLLESKTPRNTNMYALGWKDRKVKTIISNAVTTLPGYPGKRKQHKKVEKDGIYEIVTYHKKIPRPAMIELFLCCFGAIDVHDTTTKVTWHLSESGILIVGGIACLLLFGMCIVDAYLAYKFEAERNGVAIEDFKGFIGKLAYQLIHYHYIDQPMELCRNSNVHDDVSVEVNFA